MPLVPEHEHALLVLDGTRLLLLGGEPFGEQVFMWWNFVARSREEIDAAWHDWQSGAERFGDVASDLPRIDAPPPMWRRTG